MAQSCRVGSLAAARRGAPVGEQAVVYRYLDESGELAYEVVRRPGKTFIQRRPGSDGKSVYDLDGVERVPYRLPELRAAAVAGQAVFIVEGEKDADRLSLLGVAVTTSPQGTGFVWPDDWPDRYFSGVPTAYVLADNDDVGRKAARTRAEALAHVVPDVRLIEALPGVGEHGDVSDYLDAGHSVEDLFRVAEAAETVLPMGPVVAMPSHPYRATAGGLVWDKAGTNGAHPVPLTNFTAMIVGEEIRDDGVEQSKRFSVELERAGRRARTDVTPQELLDIRRWALEALGARAIVYCGQTMAQRAVEAVQELSGEPPVRRVLMHTGWRRLDDGTDAFLHGGGAVGPDGPIDGVSVELGAGLDGFRLPSCQGSEPGDAVRSSLNLLEVAPDVVTVPLLGAVFRAVLGDPDFGLFLVGQTGTGKSQLAALAQQHFGAGLNANALPASWSGTANANEAVAFTVKDCVLVVDDFAPEGARTDKDRLHASAARLFRAAGNHAGRRRMNSDASLRSEKPPRALIVATGEDVPRGASIRARLVVVDVEQGAVRWDLLTGLQDAAGSGQLASALSSYVAHLARNLKAHQGRFTDRCQELRTVLQRGPHRRTASAMAALQASWELFVEFAIASRAVGLETGPLLMKRVRQALDEVAQLQESHQVTADPAARYLELLGSAFSAGECYLVKASGDVPEDPGAWGWRREPSGPSLWAPGKTRVGFQDGEAIYIDPVAAFQVVERLCAHGSEGLGVSESTLRRRLWERGVLKGRDENRQVFTVRKQLGGARREYLWLDPAYLGALLLAHEPDHPDHPDHSMTDR